MQPAEWRGAVFEQVRYIVARRKWAGKSIADTAEIQIHLPVEASETRTSQLPPSRAWRSRAMIVPNASK